MILPALFSLFLADVPAPLFPLPVETIDARKLTFRRAETLNGKPVRLACVVETLPYNLPDGLLFKVEAMPSVSVSVRFPLRAGADVPEIGQRLIVEGRLITRLVPGRITDSERFEWVRSVEIVGVRVIRP